MSIKSILDEWGKDLVPDLQDSHSKNQRKKAQKHGTIYNEGSTLNNTIRFQFKEVGDAIEFQLIMADYWVYVNKGRGSGPVSEEGKRKIENWIRVKGIDPRKGNKKLNYQSAVKSMAFAVARKISRKGFQGTGFYTSVIKDGRIEELKLLLKEEFKKEVIISFKDGNNTTPGTS
jgi:hypothetical protein